MKNIYIKKEDGTVIQLIPFRMNLFNEKGELITAYQAEIIDPAAIDNQVSVLQEKQKAIADLEQAEVIIDKGDEIVSEVLDLKK